MTKKKILLLVLVIFVTIMTIAGCSDKSNSNNEGILKKNQMQKDSDSASISLPAKLENPNIIVFPINIENAGEAALSTGETFEKKYAGKITYEAAPTWNEEATKLVTLIASGNPPDVVIFNQAQIINYEVRNLIQPINDYFDLNDPLWNKSIMEQMVFKRKNYGVCGGINPKLLYYNKTMFENNGLETPWEHYKKGQWNLETFKEAAMALTQDTDGDGAIDQWGYGTGHPQLFVFATGGEFVDFNEDGTILSGLSNQKTIEGFQFIQDVSNKYKFILQKQAIESNEFPAGKVAMVNGKKYGPNWSAYKALKDMKYEWDVVPFPLGPGAEGKASSEATFKGIGMGAKNPQGAAAWIYTHAKISKEIEDKETREVYTDEQIQMINKLEQNIKIDLLGGIGKINNIFYNKIMSQLKKGTPVQSVVESITPEYQAELDLINKEIK